MMTASLVLNLLLLIVSCVCSASIDNWPKLLVPDVMQSTRIVGGVAAKRGEFKGQVSLQNRFRSHVCGGTMIDERHIITAAHCYQSRNTIVYVMGDDLVVSKVGSDTRQLRIVENFVIHPEYDENTLDNDIAIIRIDAAFKTTTNFSTIPLSMETPNIGQTCYAVGWGTTSYESDMGSVQLLKVKVEVFNRTFCNSDESYDGIITPSMFCAGDIQGEHDACQGDSGGLLTCNDQKLTGIVSFGYECGHPEFPGVYTDVSQFIEWINETIARNVLPAYEFAIDSTTLQPTDEPTTPTIPTTTQPGTASTISASITVLILFALLGQSLI